VIDLDNTEEVNVLVKAVLGALARLFDTKMVKVDASILKAARLAKVPGTWARKGGDIKERPEAGHVVVPRPKRVRVNRAQPKTGGRAGHRDHAGRHAHGGRRKSNRCGN
jgi:hypothetical protein